MPLPPPDRLHLTITNNPLTWTTTSTTTIIPDRVYVHQYAVDPAIPSSDIRLGMWVRVVSGDYSYTRPGSYGLVVREGERTHDVLLVHVEHPDFDQDWDEAPEDDPGRFVFGLRVENLRRLERNEITATHINRLSDWEQFYEIPFDDFLESLDRPTMRPRFSRSRETVLDVIKRLHTQQQFYKEHKDDLPSWTPSSSD